MSKNFSKKPLRFLIAYGPTQEPLDPVRYLSNYSTGTMGRLLITAAKKAGHHVTAVECPKDARSARDLLKKLKMLLPTCDVLVMNAAVGDVRPKTISSVKIKKENLSTIRLVRNPDILASLSAQKKSSQVFVGFGLESDNMIKNGVSKIKSKNLELIVLQEVTDKISPFGQTKVNALILDKKGHVQSFKNTQKEVLAKRVIFEAQIRAKTG